VDYAHIAVLDAAAIQEQQGKIESLKEQLDSLKAANDNLQREVGFGALLGHRNTSDHQGSVT
jgi:hypothetical protein